MSRFDDARELVKHATGMLPKIREAYEQSLRTKNISFTLKVEIKNFLENLRSALDFSAVGLFEKYGSSTKSKPRVYFPYATAGQDQAEFEKSGRIDACIPGIAANPDVVKALLAVQHFAPGEYKWLPTFMELTNENKHQGLSPQVRRESIELRITGGGASIGLGEGASISLGPGASISIGGAIIRGGQTFGVGQPPKVEGGTVETITWVSFHFDSNGQPVLPLLESALKGIAETIKVLAKL